MYLGEKLIQLAAFCIFAGVGLNLSFAADAPYAYQSGRQAQVVRAAPPSPAARIAVVDPYYTPGNPNCYLRREVAASPYGPVLWYNPVCR